ncbi:MAG: hypothetical protein ABL878_04720 [Burkholderiales bacterium]
MSLRDWQRNSWLVEHKTSAEEISALLAIVERDLSNSKVKGLADDWRLSIAYNAALQAATAAREQHHFRTIQSLTLTIGWPPAKVDRFDRLRKKRNIGGYETAGVVSEREAGDMYELAVGLRDDVLALLRNQHPYLLRA